MDGARNKWIVYFAVRLALAATCGFALLQSGLLVASHTARHVSPVSNAMAASPGYNAPAAATWSTDPRTPGENLPPVGRSLFDFLVVKEVDGEKTYHVPFPFQALIQRIAAQLQPDAAGTSPIKEVLIPLGRSLQRNAASPHFFKYPRVVAAVDTGPRLQRGRSGMLLKDRLYLGYQEKANVIEVISYNEPAGRFEFQIVKDYREGGRARVFYANRAICTACHQNGGPIFSRQVWDETNANPRIASLLKGEQRDFYGIRIDRGVDIPQAIDDATDRANLFSAYQLLWREGCGGEQNDPATIRCRANAFTFMLQHRLTGGRQFDKSSGRYRDGFLPILAANWERRWPGGVHIPDPDIPNRDPLLPRFALSQSPRAARLVTDTDSVLKRLVAHSTIPSAFEPLNPRLPLETWFAFTPGAIARVITGLSESIAEIDIHRLDDYLFQTAMQSGSQRLRYHSACEFRRKSQGSERYRISFKCDNTQAADSEELSIEGRIYVEAGTLLRGVIDQIGMVDTGVVRDLEVVAGTVEIRDGRSEAQLDIARDGLHVRRADGNAIEKVALTWLDAESANGALPSATFLGDAAVTVINDFSPIHTAVAQMADQTIAGSLSVFSAEPFRRAVVMQALFGQLGMAPFEWCCVDGADLPRPMFDGDDRRGTQLVSVSADRSVIAMRPFYQFCARCHLTRERFPPTFLYGEPSEVSTNLAHCAERLYFRLSMWQLRPQERPKTPMPPVHALHALQLTPEQWRESGQLATLKSYAGNILRSQMGSEPQSTDMLTRDYETLRACLPEAS